MVDREFFISSISSLQNIIQPDKSVYTRSVFRTISPVNGVSMEFNLIIRRGRNVELIWKTESV